MLRLGGVSYRGADYDVVCTDVTSLRLFDENCIRYSEWIEKSFGKDVFFAKDEIDALYVATHWQIPNRLIRSIIYIANDN